MQLDLKSRNAVSLEFSTSIPLATDLVSQIRDSSCPDKDGASVFFDSYKGHRGLAVVKGINEDAPKYELAFAYEAVSGRRLPKYFPRIEQLIDIFSSMKERLNFECCVSFTFGKNLRPRPIISLPMKYIEAPNMPFDRIQGLHLVKLDGNKAKYDVFLEAPTQGVLVETVVFEYTSTIDKSVADNILAEAESISSTFVSRESKDARKAK